VPIGLRTARAQLRQRELIIARDRANLDQGLHAASHLLATTMRSLDQAYEQYLAFSEAREAAKQNRDQQEIDYIVGRGIFLNYLVAVTNLGDSVIGQAAALMQYNTLLAELELQTGTILETHGVRFYEERYGSIGPLSHLRMYPQATPATPNADRYPIGTRPAEGVFRLEELRTSPRVPRRTEDLPPPPPQPPELPLPNVPRREPLPAPRPPGPGLR